MRLASRALGLALTLALSVPVARMGLAQQATPAPGHHPASPPTDTDRFRDGVRRLEELMSRIRSTESAAERRRMLVEHTSLLNEQMGIMRGLGRESAKNAGTPRSRARMLDDRLEMLEVILEQMLAHEQEAERTAPDGQ